MANPDLETVESPNFAELDLDYEGFRRLSRNPNLSVHEKIGFPDSYRKEAEAAIFSDVKAKLPPLLQSGRTVVDIGPGCANLPRMLIDLCARQGHRLVLVDSPEMLDLLPDAPGVAKVQGMFPRNLDAVRQAAGGPVDALLCYSVLHYMYLDTNLFDAIDAIVAMLGPGGSALIGDIPNVSKRKRFFASPTGIAYHKNFMQTEEPPVVRFNTAEPGRIDDAVLAGLIQRSQLAGCDAYLVPQAPTLPMANRRDDLLIMRP